MYILTGGRGRRWIVPIIGARRRWWRRKPSSPPPAIGTGTAAAHRVGTGAPSAHHTGAGRPPSATAADVRRRWGSASHVRTRRSAARPTIKRGLKNNIKKKINIIPILLRARLKIVVPGYLGSESYRYFLFDSDLIPEPNNGSKVFQVVGQPTKFRFTHKNCPSFKSFH